MMASNNSSPSRRGRSRWVIARATNSVHAQKPPPLRAACRLAVRTSYRAASCAWQTGHRSSRQPGVGPSARHNRRCVVGRLSLKQVKPWLSRVRVSSGLRRKFVVVCKRLRQSRLTMAPARQRLL